MDTREHYVDNQVIEGSEDFRAPTDADRKMLQARVLCYCVGVQCKISCPLRASADSAGQAR